MLDFKPKRSENTSTTINDKKLFRTSLSTASNTEKTRILTSFSLLCLNAFKLFTPSEGL